ncbi:MAG TPA: hypothetical protein VHB74_01690 [Devosia sp.]|nr:hypothetical protein [Devosia sp.]
MIDIVPLASVLVPSFLASLVEVVEAFTIVLAVWLTQGWRPAAGGALGGLVVLAVIIAVLGPLLQLVPLTAFQFAIGVLLVLFGLKWLRKAILRAAGLLPLRDEDQAFARETSELKRRSHGSRRGDAAAALVAFNAVLIEGLEVAFIVVALGAGHGMVGYASLGAAAAVLVVLIAGAALHRPLSRVPENGLKFVVGLMAVSFGIFWIGEGLGAAWPGGDWSLLVLLAVFAALSLGAVARLRPLRRGQLKVVK